MESKSAESQVPPPPPQGSPVVDAPRPLRTLGKAAIAVLGLVVLANLVALWADVVQLDLAQDVRDGERVSFETLDESDRRVAAAGLLQGAIYLVAGVAFLIWYGRAYRNIMRMGIRNPRWGTGWAIAYWFIPVVNLMRPKQVVNDIWRGSDPQLPVGGGAWRNGQVPALIHWWWALWLISSFIGYALFRASIGSPETPDAFVAQAWSFVAWDVIDVIPVFVAMAMILAVTNRQEERIARFLGGELAVGPAGGEDGPPEGPAAETRCSLCGEAIGIAVTCPHCGRVNI